MPLTARRALSGVDILDRACLWPRGKRRERHWLSGWRSCWCLAVLPSAWLSVVSPVAALLSGCAWFALLPVCCDSLLPLAAACLLGSVLLLPLAVGCCLELSVSRMGSARAVSAAVPSGRPPAVCSALAWPRCLCSVGRSVLAGGRWLARRSVRRGPRLPTGRVPAGCVALSAGLAWLCCGCWARRLCRAAAACGCCLAAALLSALLGCSAWLLLCCWAAGWASCAEPGRCRSSPAVASALLPPAGRCSLPGFAPSASGLGFARGLVPPRQLGCCAAVLLAPSVCRNAAFASCLSALLACLLLLGTWLCWLAGPCC